MSSTSRFDVYFVGIISSSFLLIFIVVKQDFLTYKLKSSLKDTSGFWGKVNNIYIFFFCKYSTRIVLGLSKTIVEIFFLEGNRCQELGILILL